MSQAGIINVGGGPTPPIETLTGNTGGPVSPSGNNINVEGDGTTITISGNPGTHTLTASLVGGHPAIQFINGDTGQVGNSTTVFLTGRSTAGETVQFIGDNLVNMRLQVTSVLGDFSTYIGNSAGKVGYSGNNNTSVGYLTLNSITSGSFNTSFGSQSLSNLTTASGNAAFGYQTLNQLIDGDDNVAIGNSALHISVHDISNTAIGDASLLLLNGGNNNTAVGKSSFPSLATGTGNTGVGFVAGFNYSGSESYNTLIGYQVQGVVGENNVIRISDNTSSQPAAKCFIGGIAGVTTSSSQFVTINTVTGQLGSIAGSVAAPIEKINVDTTTGAGTNPVLPLSGAVTFTGGQYATGTFGTRVVTINSPAANTVDVEVQISAANASSLITKNGVAHFDSASFAVDANGFVTMAGGGGFTWSNKSANFSALKNNGYFITGTCTATLPTNASSAIGDTIRFFVQGAFVLTLQAAASQKIQIASNLSSAAGTQVSTANGDAVEIVFNTTANQWNATSFVGAFNFT